ncbi:Acetyltransferase [Colletotrichum shisoi]|uniref:Acetyltransferase n=1 Tax=Colletotrichum shisoi TaxID=2078593 RepID=A0A5Q4BS92_9PEZI|nr:Acetyltransferase [Colletotrichum shisoi]
MITDGHENAYRSARLIYRAVENNESDSTFIHTQPENEPVIVALSDLKLLKPRSSKHGHAMTEKMANSILTVMVCLPHGAEAGAEAEAGAGDEDKTDGSSDHRPGHQLGAGLGIPVRFRYGNFHRVYLGTMSYNERAQHLYKKLGFVEEGRSRETHWFDRKWHDLISYGMPEQEWEVLREIEKE